MKSICLFRVSRSLTKLLLILVSTFGVLVFAGTLRSQSPASQSQPVASQLSAPQNSSGEADRVISVLNVWVAIVSIMVTILIAISAGSTIYQNWRVRKDGERIKADLIAQVDKELNALKETYKLISLRPPEQILHDARKEYEPLIEHLRKVVEGQYKELTSAMSKTDGELKSHSEASGTNLSALRGELLQRPTMDSVLQEVDRRYKSPVDLQESTLRKVLNAFLRIKNLSDDERALISSELTTAPVLLPSSRSDKNRPGAA